MNDILLETAVNRRVAEELESDVDLGTEEPDDDFSSFISDQPMAMRLRDVYQNLGEPPPREIALYRMFDVWLVPHRFSLIRKAGLAEPTAVGIEVEYLHQGTTCSVISLIPAPQWQQFGSASVSGSMSGKLGVAGEVEGLASAMGVPKFSLGNLGFAADGSGKIDFSFRLTVANPVISAVGQGSSRCQWRFDKRDEPLFGKTIETWSVLVLPKRQKTLEYRMRCYYLKRTLFFSTRREGDFVNVQCKLLD